MKSSGGEKNGLSDGFLYVLDLSALLPGDVVLTASPGQFESEFIRIATRADFSHAILVVDLPNAMEAADVGVERFRLDNRAAQEPENIRVLRVKSEYSFDASKLIKCANSLMECGYADIDVCSSIFRFIPQFERGRFFCSQLVAHCFEEADLTIVKNATPLKTTPAMIADSMVFKPVEGAVMKTTSAELTFTPRMFDSQNEMTPNQQLLLAGQRAMERVRPLFEKHGFEVFSRPMALMVLGNMLARRDSSASELDEALGSAYREMGIAEIGRRCFPAACDEFFIDLTIARGILLRQIGPDDARRLLTFYEAQLPEAERTLQERQSFIVAERGAFFTSGSETLRQQLAAEWDFEALHRRSFEAAGRAASVLEMFLKHQGSLQELEHLYRSLLFGDLATLTSS